MNIDKKDTTLIILNIHELSAATALDVKKSIRLHFSDELVNMDFNCLNLDFIDSSGLGALISMQKLANERGGKLRLISPKPSVVQLLELTRLHRVFEIIS